MTREGTEEAWLPKHERLALERRRRGEHVCAFEGVRSWRKQAQMARDERVRALLPRVEAVRAAREHERQAKRAAHEEWSGLYGTGSTIAAGWPITWAWLQWLGSYEYIAHVETANYQQAIDALPLQVILFPFEVCVYLLNAQPALWSIQSVVPNTITPSTDAVTGLNYLTLASNNVWCYDPVAQDPAFSDSGPQSAVPASLFLDGSGAPYLIYYGPIAAPGSPGLPTVTGQGASLVSYTTVTLNGDVNPQGGEGCTWYFQYGPTTAYGTNSPPSAALLGSDGFSQIPVSVDLTGLGQGGTYHARLVANNSFGPAFSPDFTFTTTSAHVFSRTSVEVSVSSDLLVPVTALHGSAVSIADTSASSDALTSIVSGSHAYSRSSADTSVSHDTLTNAFLSGAPVNTVAPTISGTAVVGDVLTCSQGSWTGVGTLSYAYQWTDSGANISGATLATYTVRSADVGLALGCTVTATASGRSTSASAPPVTPVAAGGGTVLFLGDFSNQSVSVPTMNLRLSQWGVQQGAFQTNLNSFPYAGQTLYPMASLPGLGLPAHAGHPYALRIVSNAGNYPAGDVGAPIVAPYSNVHAPGPNISSCIIEQGLFTAGGLFFIGFSVMLDPSFPAMGSGAFNQVMEIFSSPFGSPIHQLSIEGVGQGVPAASVQSWFYSTGSGAGQYPWTSAATNGVWTDFVFGINFNTNASIGYVQIWKNGALQTFNGTAPSGVTGLGTNKLFYATKAPNTNDFYLANYRTPFVNDTIVWVCGAKVGTTYAAVAP